MVTSGRIERSHVKYQETWDIDNDEDQEDEYNDYNDEFEDDQEGFLGQMINDSIKKFDIKDEKKEREALYKKVAHSFSRHNLMKTSKDLANKNSLKGNPNKNGRK